MRKKTYHQLTQEPQKLEISLFPFLSIFLCTMGILSFINVISSFSTPQKIELTAELETGYKVAFQIFTLPSGVIMLPPTKNLKLLQSYVANDSKDPNHELHARYIQRVIERRQGVVKQLNAYQGELTEATAEPDIDNILQITQEIRLINEIAHKSNYLYEEFLLFGIYPDGGEAYQKVRDVMTFTQDYVSISVGIEPLDSNWVLNLKDKKSAGGVLN